MTTPDSRVPESGVGEWFRGAGGLRLRCGFWEHRGKTLGTVFISPGRSEPIEKYYELIGDLHERGFAVVAHDWRGQGLSARLLPDRLKCHARSADEFVDDFKSLLDSFEDRAPKPWLMIGHSMGGAINLKTLLDGETRIAGAILTAPMLRVKTGGPSLWAARFKANWKVNHGHASDYVPELFDDPFENTFEKDALTHDQRRYEIWQEHMFACPHLAVGSPTWGWVDFAIKLGDIILRDKAKLMKKLKTPITIINATADSLINSKPTKQLSKKIKGIRVVDISGAEHELWSEADEYRNQALAEFDQLAAQVASGAAPALEGPQDSAYLSAPNAPEVAEPNFGSAVAASSMLHQTADGED